MQLVAELASNLAVGNAVAIVGVPPYITVGEAAELLGISQEEALKLVNRGHLELKELESGSEYVTLYSVPGYASQRSEEMSRYLVGMLKKSEEAQTVGQ